VLLVVALALLGLLGIVAIALDGGLLLSERRHAQAVADAAALAAAADLYKNYAANQGLDPNGTAKAIALNYAAANGYANDGTRSVVTINIPPKSGDYIGKAGYVEVIVQFNQPRYFSAVFGSGAVPVGARAVASSVTAAPSPIGILLLNPTVAHALDVTGSGSVTVDSGKVVVDSDSSQAAVITGSGTVTTPEVDITGSGPGYTTTGSGQFVTTPKSGNIQTGMAPTGDPLANLPAPDPNSLPIQSLSTLQIKGNTVLQPGRYIGGISLSGSSSATLQPGIYYMDHGGFSITGSGSVSGQGVMIYNDPIPNSGQAISLTGSGSLNLTPPTGGIYQGIAIFQARDAGKVQVAITGSGSSNLLGTIYAPSSPATLTGSGGAIIGSQVICDTLTITGSGSFRVDWGGQAPPPAKDIRLVE
jgi:Flp pilus assembly protein TadG